MNALVLSFLYPFCWLLWTSSFLALPLFIVWRKLIGIYLFCKYGGRFKGFFEGADVQYYVCGETTKGVLPVLFTTPIEKDVFDPVTTSAKILADFREKFEKIRRREELKKMSYTRKMEFGYAFWLEEDSGPIEKYVRPMDFETNEQFITNEELRKVVSGKLNQSFPDEDSRCWEILIGTKPVEDENQLNFPVLVRLSHSLIDGIGMTRLFQEHFADTRSEIDSIWKGGVVHDSRRVNVAKWIRSLALFPHKATLGMWLKAEEQNIIHTKPLSGEKIAYWLPERDVPFQDALRATRRKYPDRRYNDIIMAVVSKGVDSFFKLKGEVPQGAVTALVPDHSNILGKTQLFCNRFLVTIYTLSIEDQAVMEEKKNLDNFSSVLSRIKQEAGPVHKDLDIVHQRLCLYALVEYVPMFIMKIMSQFAKYSTLGVSPLPGINREISIAGYKCQDLLILAPNFESTGINLAACGYNGKVQLSIVADKAAIKTESNARFLLDLIANETKELEDKEPLLAAR